jgi:CBS domain-containing protein
VVDSTANAAFWLGMMIGFANKYDDVRKLISFEDIRDNFDKAAKFGFDTKYTWFNDQKLSPRDLILEYLLPIAKEGLASRNINPEDISKYMNIIEDRAKLHMTGARWQLRAFTKLRKVVTIDEALTTMTSAIIKNQWEQKPVHTWDLPEPDVLETYHPSKLHVEEFMQTDLFTVQREDIIEFVAQMLEWRKIRYLPVEDAHGKLVGLVTSRLLLRHYTQNSNLIKKTQVTVKDIMIDKPITVTPTATLLEALNLMRKHRIGCLPVVNPDNELIGIITEMDFLRISVRLLDKFDK